MIWRSLAAGAALWMVFGCNRPEPAAAPQSESAADGAPAAAGEVECTGVLRPARRFVLRAKPGEELVKTEVAPGAEVREGDRLAVLASPALQAEWAATHEKIYGLRQEAAKLDTARWRKDLAGKRLEELRQRWDAAEALRGKIEGYDPQAHARELWEARQAVEQEIEGLDREIARGVRLQPEFEGLLQLQEQRLADLGGRISNLVVRAPFPGVVVRVETPVPAPDGVWLEVHDRTHFVAQGLLWQNQLAGVATGCVVTIAPDFMPAARWRGTVQSIGFAAVPEPVKSFPRYPVTVVLDEGPGAGALRDGMTVSMRIQLVSSPAAEP